MRQSKIFFILIVSIIFLHISCKEKANQYTPTTTIIEGQITSSNSPVITLAGSEEVKAAIDPSGKFIIQVELEKAGIYDLIVSNESIQIFIVPGDRITLIADQRTFTTSTFYKGDHAKENNYLVMYEKLKTSLLDHEFETLFTKPEDDFIKAVEEIATSLNASQQEFQKKNGPFDEYFAEVISEEINFSIAVTKLNYPRYYASLSADDNLILSDTYDSFLQNLEIDADDNLMLPSYKTFVLLLLDFKINNDDNDLSVSSNIKKFNSVSTIFQSEKVKNHIYYSMMSEMMETSINDVGVLIEQYSLVQTNKKYKEEILSAYNSWSTLLKGNIAPNFTCETPNGKRISLSDMKGKLIYVDIWATWCSPCLKEIPHLEKLHEKYRDREDLIIASISIDENKEMWNNMLKQKNMKGLQLYAEKKINEKLVREYQIKNIPRFVIIDKESKIWNATAPWPSSKEIDNQLNDALAN